MLLDLRADPEMERYIGDLSRRANDGVLTPAEDAEHKDFVEAVDLISIAQAKARHFLARQCAQLNQSLLELVGTTRGECL